MSKPKKPKTKSSWMKGFIITKSTRDELDKSQIEAITQIRESARKGKKHNVTR